jgi:nitrile hydratase beta subunit
VNGLHDLGGMQGFGPVVIEPDEPRFHHHWERRAFAITLAAGYLRQWNIDQQRAMRERLPPTEYLATTYYEVWLYGLERLLDARGLVLAEERAARRRDPTSPVARIERLRALAAHDVERVLGNAREDRTDDEVEPRHQVGDRVVARTINPVGHTRLPRYARGKRGVITADHGVWIFPDSMGNDLGPDPQHVYTVRFEARELWGDEARTGDAVYVDLWDDHLDPG